MVDLSDPISILKDDSIFKCENTYVVPDPDIRGTYLVFTKEKVYNSDNDDTVHAILVYTNEHISDELVGEWEEVYLEDAMECAPNDLLEKLSN